MTVKVLIIQNIIMSYRVPVYNELAGRKNIDLTVLHSGMYQNVEKLNFQVKYIGTEKKGSFVFHKENLFKLAQNYNVVIAMPDPHWLSILSLAFKKKGKYRLIFWGIGVTASYTKGFDTGGLGDRIRRLIFKRADALLFYSSYPKVKYIKKGWDKNKMFIANNTTQVLETNFVPIHRNNILFIGTLYKQKKIYVLLEAFYTANKKNNVSNKLVIIGDGPERENILFWIKNHKLKDKIILKGSVFDENIIREEFEKAIVCVSPGQAGLSVLKSMGYGVPFITRKDAITGGEIFNILSWKNGVLYNENDELVHIIEDISKNRKKYLALGKNAISFYRNERTIEQMVDGFEDAIKFVISKN